MVRIYDPGVSVITYLHGDATEFSKWRQEVVDSNPDAVKAYRRVKDLSKSSRFVKPLGIIVDENDRAIISEMTRGLLQVYEKEQDYIAPQFNL